MNGGASRPLLIFKVNIQYLGDMPLSRLQNQPILYNTIITNLLTQFDECDTRTVLLIICSDCHSIFYGFDDTFYLADLTLDNDVCFMAYDGNKCTHDAGPYIGTHNIISCGDTWGVRIYRTFRPRDAQYVTDIMNPILDKHHRTACAKLFYEINKISDFVNVLNYSMHLVPDLYIEGLLTYDRTIDMSFSAMRNNLIPPRFKVDPYNMREAWTELHYKFMIKCDAYSSVMADNYYEPIDFAHSDMTGGSLDMDILFACERDGVMEYGGVFCLLSEYSNFINSFSILTYTDNLKNNIVDYSIITDE